MRHHGNCQRWSPLRRRRGLVRTIPRAPGRPRAGPGARARAPFFPSLPQLPSGIGREVGVRAFGACLQLPVRTTSTSSSTRCPSHLGLGGLTRPSWLPLRGYLLAAGRLPHECPACPLVLTPREPLSGHLSVCKQQLNILPSPPVSLLEVGIDGKRRAAAGKKKRGKKGGAKVKMGRSKWEGKQSRK